MVIDKTWPSSAASTSRRWRSRAMRKTFSWSGQRTWRVSTARIGRGIRGKRGGSHWLVRQLIRIMNIMTAAKSTGCIQHMNLWDNGSETEWHAKENHSVGGRAEREVRCALLWLGFHTRPCGPGCSFPIIKSRNKKVDSENRIFQNENIHDCLQ